MSTKMIGETLEIHCSTLFNQMLRPVMPSAYFEKDNDASDGTKGDFIFRDFDGETEYVSIMFEMKNEMDTTATKHKNEDFFKKLDDDRKKKNCEFAVLVSLLVNGVVIFIILIIIYQVLFNLLKVVLWLLVNLIGVM